jgi:hypothetical protein
MEYKNQAKAAQTGGGELENGGNYLLIDGQLSTFGPSLGEWRKAFRNSKFLEEKLQKTE